MKDKEVVLMNIGDEIETGDGPGVMAGGTDEARRKAMFAALVAAQDRKLGVKASREAVAQQFGAAVETVEEVEDEGLDKDWPPFGKG